MAEDLNAELDGSYLAEEALNVTSEENLLTSSDNSHSMISTPLDSSGGVGEAAADNGTEDAELEAIKARVREMEEEAEKLREMQNDVEKQMNMTSPPSTPGATPGPAFLTFEEKGEVDARSVYVGNVDYSATAEELEQHFHGCGSINRVTILCNKFTGHPKGFAYIEFSEKDSVKMAETLTESLFKGRQIKVVPKRTNRPGISSTDRGRGRGRYRGGGGGYHNPYYGGGGGGYYRPRGRFRPRRASYYSPY